MGRRPKGWYKWYSTALTKLAMKAADASLVVTGGDKELAEKVFRDVRCRHYWHDAGTNGKGQDVFFCWTTRKDEAGYFRTWREVHTQTEIKRYNVAYRRTKAAAAEIARRRYNKFIGANDA